MVGVPAPGADRHNRRRQLSLLMRQIFVEKLTRYFAQGANKVAEGLVLPMYK